MPSIPSVTEGQVIEASWGNDVAAAVNAAPYTFEIPHLLPVSFGITATSYTDQYLSVIFDKSKFEGYASIHFRADLSQAASGTYAVWAQLVNLDTAVVVASSELTASLAQFAHSIQASADISANLAANSARYGLQVKTAAGGSAGVESASIVVRYEET